MDYSFINNYAYVTLLSSTDYLVAALALNKSFIDNNSIYPLIVGVTENIYNDVAPYLIKENVNFIKIPFIHYSKQVEEQWRDTYIVNIASKMALFDLKDYDKLLFVDVDSILLYNIDEIFKYPDGAMYQEGDLNYGFAGMYMFSPKNHNTAFYVCLLENFPIWESDLLGELWFPFKTNRDYKIDPKYFLNITREPFFIGNAKMIHFCYHYKPWKYKNANNFFMDFLSQFSISAERAQIINFYFDNYLNDLFKKYPELEGK